MAYAAVASLSHTIDILLNYHQHSLSPQFENQIISLHKHIDFLQSFLEDAPRRANNWEETIREVTDRAEDIIELLLSDSLLQSTLGSSKPKHEFHRNFSELERVTEEIESIVSRVKGGRRIATVDGPDHELQEIISRLRGGSSALEKIAIVGIGGIGKTTLARNAYNNPLIMEHFDIRAWSTISTDYSVRGIMIDLLRSMNKSIAVSISDSEDELISYVFKILENMRYLIVLDDMRRVRALNRMIKFMVPDNGNGSRIMLTTRLYSLALTAAYTHRKRFLNVDKGWDLLREKIFNGDPCPSQLEHFGKMIAIRCRGHPLSIEVVAGILAADQTKAAWGDVSESMKIASEHGDVFLLILYLSYTYLPHHLRPCFLYLASFPNDHEINVSKLVKLWVAEGFLSQTDCKSFEVVGEECVEDLVWRSLVSVSKRKSNGSIKSIKVHDLVHDLFLTQAHIDNFILDSSRFGRFDQQATALELQCRRVSRVIYVNDILEGVCGKTIRTIILHLNSGGLGVRCSIGNVRLLRILDLSSAYNYDLPEEVFELFYLRYLAFHHGFSISEAISNLVNLQTLIICPRENGRMFEKLPEGIWRMPQLRHLLMFCFKLPSQRGGTSALENLQTLSRVEDFVCSRDNLKSIPNLKKLVIFYTKSLRVVVEDCQIGNLIYLQKLEALKIGIVDWCTVEHHKMSCAFPPKLKKLNLCSLKLSCEDMKMVVSLPNLEVLKLRKHACIGDTWETSEGGFSQLTYLLIEKSNLEHWISKTSHFPKLKCLVLRCCLGPLEVPIDIGKIPTLELIELDEQNNQSLLSSAKQIQKDRQSLGDDRLQIRVV